MMDRAPIPLFTLERAAARIRPELEQRWGGLLDNQRFVGGEEVTLFENAFAEFLEVPESIGVANGTDALMIALKALDLRPGDEVIVPAFTFIATASAVAWVGGCPVFADVEPETLNIDVASVADKIGDKTVGVIGVHLYGNPCAVGRLRTLCQENGLWFIEDAAQAHGARIDGQRVGRFGELATWSFYPSKNLGCFGDGGAVSGRSGVLLERARKIANHGRSRHYFHDEIGVNSRLDSLQAAVLNCRLSLLDSDNVRRRQIAARYRQRLETVPGLVLIPEDERRESVYHQFTIRVRDRDGLRRHLDSEGVGNAVHYPHSLLDQPAFSGLTVGVGELPEARAAAEEVLCLPMFAELSDLEVDRACDAIEAYFAGSAV
jgi:dTDP-4-amino-4,6-dideoxygalactose transaminase